jgi:hypothetical protein
LGGYFDDVVEFESKKARMEVTLVDLPPILQIQLQVGFSFFWLMLFISIYLGVEGTIQS